MTHPNKNKGNNFERWIVNHFNDLMIDAKRAYASDGRSLGHHEEVDVLLAGHYKVQAKRYKAMAKKFLPSEHVDCVIAKPDRIDPVVILPLEGFITLFKESQG